MAETKKQYFLYSIAYAQCVSVLCETGLMGIVAKLHVLVK